MPNGHSLGLISGEVTQALVLAIVNGSGPFQRTAKAPQDGAAHVRITEVRSGGVVHAEMERVRPRSLDPGIGPIATTRNRRDRP